MFIITNFIIVNVLQVMELRKWAFKKHIASRTNRKIVAVSHPLCRPSEYEISEKSRSFQFHNDFLKSKESWNFISNRWFVYMLALLRLGKARTFTDCITTYKKLARLQNFYTAALHEEWRICIIVCLKNKNVSEIKNF